MRQIIDINDWDITYTELMYWIADTGARLKSVTTDARRIPTEYEFERDEDALAFKLKFSKSLSRDIGFSIAHIFL